MRYTLKIETGTYTGNGAGQEIAACDGASWVITKRINGGLNGYQERLAYHARAKMALGVVK